MRAAISWLRDMFRYLLLWLRLINPARLHALIEHHKEEARNEVLREIWRANAITNRKMRRAMARGKK